MAFYTADQVASMIDGSDPGSDDESDIEEDPDFPLPLPYSDDDLASSCDDMSNSDNELPSTDSPPHCPTPSPPGSPSHSPTPSPQSSPARGQNLAENNNCRIYAHTQSKYG